MTTDLTAWQKNRNTTLTSWNKLSIGQVFSIVCVYIAVKQISESFVIIGISESRNSDLKKVVYQTKSSHYKVNCQRQSMWVMWSGGGVVWYCQEQGAGFLKVSKIVLILLQHVNRLVFLFQYSMKLFSKYCLFFHLNNYLVPRCLWY